MTKKELTLKIIQVNAEADTDYLMTKEEVDKLAKISIEYAISVLEDMKTKLSEGLMRYPVREIELRIEELKKQL